MAKGEIKMNINMLHNLFSLCSVQCLQTVCRYRRKDSLDCGRKDIIINASGECAYFEDISVEEH